MRVIPRMRRLAIITSALQWHGSFRVLHGTRNVNYTSAYSEWTVGTSWRPASACALREHNMAKSNQDRATA